MTLGQRIKKSRKLMGLTQQQLAQKLDITQTAVSKYEKDERTVPYKILISLSHIFGESINYLLGLED